MTRERTEGMKEVEAEGSRKDGKKKRSGREGKEKNGL